MIKYNLEILLLYLDNQISNPQQVKDISDYLLQNKDLLQYVIELSKLKALDEVNLISFEWIKDVLVQKCGGLVEFLQEQKLAFRGDVQSYQYKLQDIELNFLHTKDDKIQLQINTPCEIVRDDNEIISHNSGLLSLDTNHVYYLFIKNENDFQILKISI